MYSQSFQLQINHIGSQDDAQNKPQFVVVRGSDLKFSAPVTLTGPDQTVVPDRPTSRICAGICFFQAVPQLMFLLHQ
jgi:hypothetical protein